MSKQVLLVEIKQRIEEFTERDVSHITGQTHLLGALPGQDSLNLMEMLMYLEDCFEVEFEDKVVEKIKTLDDLVDYIGALREQGSTVEVDA